MEKISLIIPCRNEEKYLSRCLDSILNNDYPKEFLEVFIVDGLSGDSSQKIIKDYENRFSFIHLLLNENKTVPYAMNLGIKNSTGEYIIRLDAHSEIPNDYISKLIFWSKKLTADNIGAIWITDIKNKNLKSNSIKKVLSNKIGVGNSFFRIGLDQIKEVDTVPFGCYKKNVFEKIGLYNNKLTRNQDIELNKRLKSSGGKIYLLPDLFCTYYARETFWELSKNNYLNGLWNILTVYITKRIYSVSIRHFIPLIFLLSIILPVISMIWNPLFGYAAVVFSVIYILTILTASLKIRDEHSSFYFIFLTFIILHFSYGFGSLIGLFRINFLYKRN